MKALALAFLLALTACSSNPTESKCPWVWQTCK